MHTAHYDSDGNIILVDTDEGIMHAEAEHIDETPVHIVTHVSQVSRNTNRCAWTVVHEPSTLTRLSATTKRVLGNGAVESKNQVRATIADTKHGIRHARRSLRQLPQRVRTGLMAFWRSVNAPVQLPHFAKRGKKPPTKLRLFVIDTVRFGGTFAAIFVVLFVGINYQSFLQIARADLALDDTLKTQQGLQRMTSGSIAKKTMVDLKAVLPRVGPYQNRLIIPKLGKNVPIVRPSMDALMKEDWTKFEKDIQTALEDGVVYYPGSAAPGQAGNFFLTAHSSYYPWAEGDYKDVFARLGELEKGDTYSVYYGGDLHTYRVTSKKEVRPNNVSVLDQPTDKRIATLMTCTPIGTTLRRLIVVAEEIDASTGIALAVGEKTNQQKVRPVAKLESLPI